jgi:hypothetical protein
MSTMIPSTLNEQAGDEIDGLLRAFFQAEMPKPWPAFKAPVTPSANAPGFWAKSRSRFALAASVTMLLLGSWWLANQSVEYATPLKGVSTETSGDAKGGAPSHLKKAEAKPASNR